MAARQAPAAPGARRIDFAAIAFALAVLALAFAGGMAVVHFRAFPYPQTLKAVSAAKALADLEDDRMMAGLIDLDPAAPAQPAIRTLAPGAGSEALLVTGGPYQNLARCPKFGCVAWVIDRQGRVLHSWEVDTEALFAGLENVSGRTAIHNFYPIGIALHADGGLSVTYHARNTFPYEIGIARIDRNGRVLWKHFDASHHWIDTDAAGRTYAPSMRRIEGRRHFGTTAADVRCGIVQFDEGIRVYAPDGRLEREFWAIDELERAGYPGLLYALRDDCDPIHANSVQVASAQVAANLPGIAPGDLLVSFREPNVIAVMDATSGHIKRLVAGRTAAQHSPKFLPDGTVLAFDNLGGDRRQGGTRVAHVNLVTGATTTVFPRKDQKLARPVESHDGGTIDISPDGKRMMVAIKKQGRTLEVEIATGRILWEMDKGFDIGPFLKARGIDAPTTRGWFNVYGSYYLSADDLRAIGIARERKVAAANGDAPARRG